MVSIKPMMSKRTMRLRPNFMESKKAKTNPRHRTRSPVVFDKEKARDFTMRPPSSGLIGRRLNKFTIAIHAAIAATMGHPVHKYRSKKIIAKIKPQMGPQRAITLSAFLVGKDSSVTAAAPKKGIKYTPLVFIP